MGYGYSVGGMPVAAGDGGDDGSVCTVVCYSVAVTYCGNTGAVVYLNDEATTVSLVGT